MGLKREFLERLSLAINAQTESDLISAINRHYNFFKYGDDEYERNEKFSICEYSIDPGVGVTITGKGTPKTLAEHRADLKREFGDTQGDVK